MLNIVLVVLAYECVTALAFIFCWRLVRGVDTRLPITEAKFAETQGRSKARQSGREWRNAPELHWQIFAMLLGGIILGGVALTVSGALGELRPALVQVELLSGNLQLDPIILRLLLPVGHFLVLGVLFVKLRSTVLFPAVLVHFFLITFCLLVSLFDPARIETGRLTLVPIFVTNLVLLILTHGLLTLLFCRSAAELAAAVVLSAVAGAILALGTMVISLASTLIGGPLFFFQLYLVSAFGIFGLYFCIASMVLTFWLRDERGPASIPNA